VQRYVHAQTLLKAISGVAWKTADAYDQARQVVGGCAVPIGQAKPHGGEEVVGSRRSGKPNSGGSGGSIVQLLCPMNTDPCARLKPGGRVSVWLGMRVGVYGRVGMCGWGLSPPFM
jgi:hypothetical protein